MKKIVAAASLATMLAGAAFAADISFSYIGRNYFESKGDDNISYDSNSREDCMALGIKNDYAGAVVDFDIIKGSLELDEYYAWMNFADISTQFTAGRWNSRYVDRVITDKGELDKKDFELFKPGVLKLEEVDDTTNNKNNSVAIDSDNLTDGTLAMAAAYTNADSLPGKLMIKGVLVNNEWDSFSKVDGTTSTARTNKFGFAGEVAYRQENAFDVNLAIKSAKHVGQYSFGLFFSPLMVEKLQATVGLTLGLDSWTLSERNGNASNETGTEFAADLRLRYAVTDKFSVTTMHNFSSYLAGKKADDPAKWADNKKAMWNMLNVTYAFLDNMKFGLTLNHVIADFDAEHGSKNSSLLIVSPSVAIQATERASVTVAARGTFDKLALNQYNEFTFKIPVIFKYAF